MKFLTTYWYLSFTFLVLTFTVSSCVEEQDMGLPITNDFRLLQTNIDGNTTASGAANVSVIPNVELVFSHAVNTTAFEGALGVSPTANYVVEYDESGSIVTLSFPEPLEYETNYSITLPRGTYGANGETSVEDVNFSFSTQPFSAPNVSLSSNVPGLFEGETVSVTAALSFVILNDVTLDVNFAGVAEQDVDFSASATSLTIPAGSTSASFDLTGIVDAENEGSEDIIITISNLMNALEADPQELTLTLGDQPPVIELKGVMSLKINGTGTNGRAVHLRVLEDIADLSVFGLGIANNGGGSDGREIDFPAVSVVAGDDILLVRDQDRTGLADYFGDFFNDFELVIETGGLNFNGDDPFELYQDQTVIETYGDVELDGTGEVWEYTGAWAYKINGFWEYSTVDCSANSTSPSNAACAYPFVVPMQLYGVMAILWDGSGNNGGKAVHLRAHRDIDDLSIYSLGTTNNGGGTDGIEYTLPARSVSEGEHILVAREPASMAAYFGACFDNYAIVDQGDAMNQNGDDGIELFNGMDVIETYGDANVDGTGQSWEYSGTWAYRINGVWVVGDLDCAAGSTSTQSSACPYGFCL